jgi:hypothetical protein
MLCLGDLALKIAVTVIKQKWFTTTSWKPFINSNSYPIAYELMITFHSLLIWFYLKMKLWNLIPLQLSTTYVLICRCRDINMEYAMQNLAYHPIVSVIWLLHILDLVTNVQNVVSSSPEGTASMVVATILSASWSVPLTQSRFCLMYDVVNMTKDC